jgi:uncharacterized damage-inducible protein DinB
MAMADRAVTESVREKVAETIERLGHLVWLVPPGRLEWRPTASSGGDGSRSREFVDMGHLLGHMLTCLAGFCAAFYAAFPGKLSGLAELRALKVDHDCGAEEARSRIQEYSAAIEKGFEICNDEDLGRRVRTVFVPEGETLMTLLLGNLEHTLNHKYQLFFYLRLLGLNPRTADLYHLRGQ